MGVMSVQEAKANLSKLIAAAERGETAVIARRGLPVATLTAIKPAGTRPLDIYPLDIGDEAARESLAPVYSDGELRELGLA